MSKVTGKKNQFFRGTYGGPARPCVICGTRTTNIRDCRVEVEGRKFGHVPHFCPECESLPLPIHIPAKQTSVGYFAARSYLPASSTQNTQDRGQTNG